MIVLRASETKPLQKLALELEGNMKFPFLAVAHSSSDFSTSHFLVSTEARSCYLTPHLLHTLQLDVPVLAAFLRHFKVAFPACAVGAVDAAWDSPINKRKSVGFTNGRRQPFQTELYHAFPSDFFMLVNFLVTLLR